MTEKICFIMKPNPVATDQDRYVRFIHTALIIEDRPNKQSKTFTEADIPNTICICLYNLQLFVQHMLDPVVAGCSSSEVRNY